MTYLLVIAVKGEADLSFGVHSRKATVTKARKAGNSIWVSLMGDRDPNT